LKTAFVILHYLTAEDTLACIQSIQAHALTPDTSIVVVDNHSPNDSLAAIRQATEGQPEVHIVALDSNLGFAQGNNAGIRYAVEQLGAEMAIVINNDTLIEQDGWVDQLWAKYAEEPFDILGPDILSIKHQIHQNPDALQAAGPAAVRTRIQKLRTDLLMQRVGLYALLVFLVRLKNGGVLPTAQRPKARSFIQEQQENIVLHGSALVFSPSFLAKYVGFYPGTFMYCEEEILYHIAQEEPLRMVYWPALQILHKEDAATDAVHGSDRRKKVFKMQQVLRSLKLLQAMQKGRLDYRTEFYRQSGH
jgi:GT2 family glycosyltransferase